METRSRDRAKDCELGSMDWTNRGARIIKAATIASAIHLMETAATQRKVVSDDSPVMFRERGTKTPSERTVQRAWMNSENFIG